MQGSGEKKPFSQIHVSLYVDVIKHLSKNRNGCDFFFPASNYHATQVAAYMAIDIVGIAVSKKRSFFSYVFEKHFLQVTEN